MATTTNDDGSQTVILKEVYIAYPSLAEATKYDPDNEAEIAKFSAKIFIPKGTESAEKVQKVFEEVTSAKQIRVANLGSKTRFLNDGADSDREQEADYLIASAKSKYQPLLVSKSNTKILDKEDIRNTFQSGCKVNVQIKVWATDKKATYGEQIRATLLAVQHLGAGIDLTSERSSPFDCEGEDVVSPF